MNKTCTIIFVIAMISVPIMIFCDFLKLEIALSFLTSTIASYIACQQYLTSKAKLQLDLFEKRYKVYDATRTFLGIILTHHKYTEEDFQIFSLATCDCEILFGDETSAYLKEIKNKAINMTMAKEEMLASTLGTAQRTLFSKEEQNNRYWLDKQIIEGKMNIIFKPHIEFSNIRS